MIKNILILILFFYVLVLVQTSFLINFSVRGYIPNLIVISVVLLNIFQKPESYSGLAASAIGGFFLDIFSGNFIGFWILMLLAATFVIKFTLMRHVRLPKFEKI